MSKKKKNKLNNNNIINSINNNIDKLCIYYGIKKFSQSQNIETFETSSQIYQYIQECNKNKIVIHQKIREVWKYYINIRKFSMIALAHTIIKSNKNFIIYKNIISETMLDTFHFLKKEYKNYSNNKLCRNQHDFAKSITPIIRSLSQLFNEFDFQFEPDQDIILQIIDDLKDLMILGTNCNQNKREYSEGNINNNSNNNNDETKSSLSSSDNEYIHNNNDNIINNNKQKDKSILSEYSEYSKRDRHRYRSRVLLDWNGEQYRHGNGYTSDSVLGSAEKSDINIDKSFFVPFDIFSKLRMYVQHCLGLLVKKNLNHNYFHHFWNKLLPKDITSAMSTRPFY